MRTINDLYELQKIPLEEKIEMTKDRIDEWVNKYGVDGVYISFSGGKDSTVLLDLVRNVCGYKEIPAVFVDVPTQFPELRQFVKQFDNVEVIMPKYNFMQVVEKYGFPLISKEVTNAIYTSKKYIDKNYRQNDDESIEDIEKRIDLSEIPCRLAIMLGKYDEWYELKHGCTSRKDGKKTIFTHEKYKFFLDAPFDVSDQCCNIMKKNPAHQYHKDTGRNPIIATMATESRLRTQKWLENGCNGWNLQIPTSTPMSFWTEQDVLKYIKDNKLPICSVYGDIIEDYGDSEKFKGQMNIFDFIDKENLDSDEEDPVLKTTGCDRTGCVLCGFGCHITRSSDRFEKLKKSHPKMYQLLDIVQNNGVTYREAIDWINEHGNMNIKY